MTPFEPSPMLQILQDIDRGEEPARAVIHRHGMSPKSFLAACNAQGGIQVIAAKGQLYQAFQERQSSRANPRD